MDLAEPVVNLKLLVPTNCFAYPRGDHAMVFREPRPLKPLEELAKRGDNWNDSVVRSCFKQLAERPEHEFLIDFQSNQILQLCCSLS